MVLRGFSVPVRSVALIPIPIRKFSETRPSMGKDKYKERFPILPYAQCVHDISVGTERCPSMPRGI